MSTTSGRSPGTLRSWSADVGTGVADCVDTPGGCWVSASVVASLPAQGLRAGQPVEVDWEREPHDGFDFRATRVALRNDLTSSPGA